MAVKIPDLTAATVASLTDLLEVSQSGVSKKETLQQILTLFKLAQVSGTPSGNTLVMFTADEDGTLLSSGYSPNNFAQTSEDLSDLQGPIKGRNNIKAMANGGYIQPTITTETLVLTNPAPTYIELSNFNGDPDVGIQLPPPYDVDSVDGFVAGSVVIFDNVLGNHLVPIYQYNDIEEPILELEIGGYYAMVVKNSAGDVAFRQLVG